MGDPEGFLKVPRVEEDERPIDERVQRLARDHRSAPPEDQVRAQASRCMDCGIPFCHQGCPLGNLIPEWNDLVHRGKHDEAAQRLAATNNFPEVTGRVCPAPCEASCVLNLRGEPVTIKTIERTIADHVFERAPRAAARERADGQARGGRGLGSRRPRGRAAAGARGARRRRSSSATIASGGLLRYGIPDFKMEKEIIDARVEQMTAEGVRFRVGRCGGCRRARRAAPARFRRRASGDGRARAARSADAGARASRRALRDGVPRAAEPPRRGRA